MIAKLLQRNLSFFSKSVQVDYCFTWSFKSDFIQLKKQIQSLDPSITVNGSKAFLSNFHILFLEFGSFEVTVTKDEQQPVVLYSGLEKGKIKPSEIPELAKRINELWDN